MLYKRHIYANPVHVLTKPSFAKPSLLLLKPSIVPVKSLFKLVKLRNVIAQYSPEETLVYSSYLIGKGIIIYTLCYTTMNWWAYKQKNKGTNQENLGLVFIFFLYLMYLIISVKLSKF